MADNTENIEARLCAYVEDDLNPSERAEIEEHLAANPTHGALLQDLIRHRTRLRELPREHAPRDLMEGFQSQLEREALIGGEPLQLTLGRARAPRWPQILSAAAIISLATGLGIVVYSVLPPHTPTIAIVQPRTDDTRRSLDGAFREATESELLARDNGGERSKNLSELAVVPNLTVAASQATDAYALDEAVQSTLNTVGLASDIADNGTLMITVSANDLKAANSEVVRFLATNNIEYSETTDPGVLANESASLAYASRGAQGHGGYGGGYGAGYGGFGGGGGFGGTNVKQLTDKAAGTTEAAQKPDVARTAGPRTELPTDAPASADAQNTADNKRYNTPAPAPTRGAAPGGYATRENSRETLAESIKSQPAPARQPEKKTPVLAKSTDGATVDAEARSRSENNTERYLSLARSARDTLSAINNSDGNARVIYARRMNSLQAAQLTGSLSQLSETGGREVQATLKADNTDQLQGGVANYNFSTRAEMWYFKEANANMLADLPENRKEQVNQPWYANDPTNNAQGAGANGPVAEQRLLRKAEAGIDQFELDRSNQGRAILNETQLAANKDKDGYKRAYSNAANTAEGLRTESFRQQLGANVIPADNRAYNCVIILQNIAKPTPAAAASSTTQPVEKEIAPTLQKANSR